MFRYFVLAALLAAVPLFAPNRVLQAMEKSDLPSAQQVLDKYIEAVGGRVALSKLSTGVYRGHSYTDLLWQEPPIEACRFEAYAKLPNSVLFTYHDNEGEWRDGFDGTTGWAEKDGQVTADQEGNAKLRWLINPQNALRLEEYFPGLEVVGIREINSRPAYELVPYGTTRDRDTVETHYRFCFDTQSGLLVAFGYHNYIWDYRRCGNVLFPYRISFGRKGGATEFIFDEVVHNVPVDDKLFSPPAGLSPDAEADV